MIYSGISHYADQRDAFFLEDGRLRIRIATSRGDMSAIYLHTQDKYIGLDRADTSRFLWRAGGDKRKLALAAAFQMLTPGTPFIYYGDEIAMTGGDDPDNRRGMLWDKDLQDMDMYHWYQRLTFFRHTINALTAGSYSSVNADDDKCLLEYHLSSGEVLIFHTADGETNALEYKGYKELLSDETFDGTIPGYGCVLLRKA